MNRVLTVALLLCAACSHRSPAPTETELAMAAAERASVRAQLAAHRVQQIVRLEAYASAGRFPHNYRATEAHVFRDEAGRLCAVANLVHTDGRDDLVEATVREHNDLAIADVKEGAMLEWVVASGLTQEELARVQLPSMPLTRRPTPMPTPMPKAAPDLIAANEELNMQAAVRRHVDAMDRELRANTGTSLDIATARFIQYHNRMNRAQAAIASN
jgi:hypothetical protein